MPASPEVKRPKRRRTRQKRKSDPRSPAKGAAAPIRALAHAGPALSDKGADDPLSAVEVARMKEHFRFLKTHKKLLKLRLNAAEDLLLNGVREPSHRGVCQHLLAKVDKDRVLAVSERLAPGEAAKLLAGVLSFAPEVSYVLRYLECVSGASSKPEAASALAQALPHIDFSETSKAQMRQVLALIVSVFPSSELPLLVFSWLSNPAFRKAFDRSSEALPEELAQLVLPLRAAHSAVSGGVTHANPQVSEFGEAERARGFELLLSSPKRSLEELPAQLRRRLFDEATTGPIPGDKARQGLVCVYSSLSWRGPADEGDAALTLARALLVAGDEQRAKQVLERESLEGDALVQAKRWLRFLNAPRLGPIALDERNGRSRRRGKVKAEAEPIGAESRGRWLSGFHVPTQSMVRYRVAGAEEHAAFGEQLSLWRQVLIPGVLRPVSFQLNVDQSWLAVARVGRSLARAKAVVTDQIASSRRAGLELCALLNSLALAGVQLPDADLGRFSVDDHGRIWLADLWGATAATPEQASRRHAEHAVRLLRELFGNVEVDLAEPSLQGLATWCEAAQWIDREAGIQGAPAKPRTTDPGR